MSAVKLIFKRSSILGKRPTGENLEPGEIGLNTNPTEPGLYFEVNDGSVVKAGPTAYLPEQPTPTPARGELWVNKVTNTLSVGTDLNQWEKVAAPFLGGTSGYTVFVAPEYENSTDSLANDGQTVPFITINRAIIEVTKQIILDTTNGLSDGNNRYLIILAPGQHCVVNDPGVSTQTFSVNFSNPNTEVTQETLTQFNPEIVGGLILPRGVSIIGLDLKKCEIHPTYVPKYTYPLFPNNYQQQTNGPIYQNQPLTSIFRWSGNTYVSNWSGLDKLEHRLVTSVSAQVDTGYALFKSERPHGLSENDFVQVTYSDSADQVGATFTTGSYYAYPVNSYQFFLSVADWSSTLANPILANTLPLAYLLTNSAPDPKFNVSNIYPYFVPVDGISYELSNYSHHRLSLLSNASLSQLNNFYIKVQKTFPNIFAGQVNTSLVSPEEVDIVSSTLGEYPNNLLSNSTDNSSPYQNMVNHRSDYGMSNGDYDGNVVSGFKSVIVNSATAVILQKDPVAYEVYSSASQDWVTLTQFTQQTLGTAITSVPREPQLQNLNDAIIPNIRYYYETVPVIDPSSGNAKSTGLPDPNNDFRHFGFRVSGPNAYMQAQSTYTIGAAIGVWAKDGALISLTNATTNFGSVAFQSEGFAGIGTLGGANPINKGFLQSGVVCPLQLLEESVVSDQQKRILLLGSKVVFVGPDPNDPLVQQVYLQKPFDPATILPFSLKPGSALFTSDGACDFRGFFVTDGTATCILSGTAAQNPYSTGGAVLRLRSSDTTIPSTPTGILEPGLDFPYIRRFVDPRTVTERSYGFYIQSTNPTTQAPQLGSVLRLNQTGQSLSNTLKRNFQFDPGQYGGISQVFTVDLVETEQLAISPNFNYKIADTAQANSYVVYATLSDASNPWVQSIPEGLSFEPLNNAQGTYITYNNKNYYAAENNEWSSLYYQTTFNPLNGPTKVAPDKSDSPFVITSVLQKAELVTDSWQGYVPDPYYEYYTTGVPAPYNTNLSYMRGAVVPYTEFAPQYQYDDDDSSNSFGIIFNTEAITVDQTVMVSPSTVVQTNIPMTSPYVATPSRGLPEVIELQLMQVQQILLPKEGPSILQLSDLTLGAVEYVRVISVISNVVQVIRNYYPSYAQGVLPVTWPKGTVVIPCVSSNYPEPSVYDPDWAITKATMIRFYGLMGFTKDLIAPYLIPQVAGQRILINTDLPLVPINGYSNSIAAWPIEFNNPSSIITNTHTWQYAGYLNYSRGLPKYQVNEIPKKLSYDYLSTTAWGGRLTVTGATDSGALIIFGPIREALTSQHFNADTPLEYAANRQTYQTPTPVDFPKPVLVFSADDLSGLFDGVQTVFELTRGGYPLPSTQLALNSTFVFLGGVVQAPTTAYTIQTTSSGVPIPQIAFTEAPTLGMSCDIRVITTEDEEQTVEIVPFSLTPGFDGIQSTFVATPSTPGLSNLNSFLFLGGVEQNPAGINQTSSAYNLQFVGGAYELTFIGGVPDPDTVLDFRGILPGNKYRSAGISTVFVSSVDDIAPLFTNTRVTFELRINGVPLDPTKVNAQNMFVSLGGVMQIPGPQIGSTLAGLTYTVAVSPITKVLEITFATPPAVGLTCNIRVVASDEFLSCPLPPGLLSSELQDGPGILVNELNQIIGIDSGLIA